MKKKVILFVLTALLAVSLLLPAIASGGSQYVRDYAGLLDGGTLSELEGYAARVSEEYGVGVYVLTVDDLGGVERREFAKGYYTDFALGIGPERMGILFLVAMGTRDYVTVTYGWADAPETCPFTDYGVKSIEDSVVPELSDGDFDDAFETYIRECEWSLDYMRANGYAYDVNSGHKAPLSERLPGIVLLALVPSAIIALIVCLVFRGQMKTARVSMEADEYVPQGGFKLRSERDRFLYRTETRTYIKKDNDSHGGGASFDSGGFGGSSGGKF